MLTDSCCVWRALGCALPTMKMGKQCLFLKMFVTQMCSIAKVFSFIARGLIYLHGCVQVTVSRATGALYLGRLLTKA